jgi:hypothetical protein
MTETNYSIYQQLCERHDVVILTLATSLVAAGEKLSTEETTKVIAEGAADRYDRIATLFDRAYDLRRRLESLKFMYEPDEDEEDVLDLLNPDSERQGKIEVDFDDVK